MIGADSLTASVQGQFTFVLPWMLLAVGTVGLVSVLGCVILAAAPLGPSGFGTVLALVGAGTALTAVGFRRSLAAAT